MGPERVVSFRPRAVLSVAGVLIGLAIALWIVWVSRHVLTWVLISLFLAMAMNPAVDWLHHHRGVANRGVAAAIIYVLVLLALVGLGFLLVPPLADQVRGFVDAVPNYVDDLTKGRGPFGFLQTKYHVVDKIRKATEGGIGLSSGASTALAFTRGIVTAIFGIVTVVFMTFFMILEGPTWMDRIYDLAPAHSRGRWENVGRRIAQTVSGYVTGNLFISFVAGAAASGVLFALGVPYSLALGLLVAVLDLIPLAGATIAGVIIVTVALLTSLTAGLAVAVFVVVYQQLENHLLQPLVYGRTVELSPLAVLISVLVGAEVAGVLGALGAIPVASSLQIVLSDIRLHHRLADRLESDGEQPAAVVPEALIEEQQR
ncbi:MAG TPA: AI-2E family transporter [Baekduia sp.]|nr:AI-2E family transporter [Baekduia sp.]